MATRLDIAVSLFRNQQVIGSIPIVGSIESSTYKNLTVSDTIGVAVEWLLRTRRQSTVGDGGVGWPAAERWCLVVGEMGPSSPMRRIPYQPGLQGP